MSDVSDLSDVRGAGVEAMKALKRPTSVPPPPPPASKPTRPVIEPIEVETVVDETVVEEAPASPSEMPASDSGRSDPEVTKTKSNRRRRKPDLDDEGLIGQPKGNLRQISVRLPQQLRDLLDADNSADPNLSLGLIGMDAVRSHVGELIAQSRDQKPKDTGTDFAPPRQVVRRSARGPKVPTPMSVTPEEAKRLGELRDELGMSVNLIIERSLELFYAARLN